MKYLIVIFTTILCSACAASMQFLPAQNKKDRLLTPSIGVPAEATIGSPMITNEDRIELTAYLATKDHAETFILPNKFSPIIANTVWTVAGILENGYLLLENPAFKLRITDTFYQSCIALKNTGEVAGFAYCGDTQKDQLSTYVFTYTDSGFSGFFVPVGKKYIPGEFKQELIYNGKSVNTIKLSYREFVNDMARPSFTQDLSYDLSESKTIGFKGMQIEVVNATNSQINFIIKSPMK